MTTTPATLTDQQIDHLRAEAGAAGDQAMVALCDRALDGDDDARVACARVACARVIADAQAMED